jgi:hypothetical protein
MKKKINEIRQNPDNPKRIDYFKLQQLKKSIKEFPEMLEIRPIVINSEGIIVGGNSRWLAAKELGFEEVEVLVLEDKEKEYEFLIKDNLSYGEWNWEGLTHDFKSNELIDWGLDVPLFFRDEEVDYTELDDEKDWNEGDDKEAGKSAPKSTKKAVYLFYTPSQKENLIKKLKELKGEMSNEEVVIQKIREAL